MRAREGEQKISECIRLGSVKIPQHLNEVLLWFASTTSFNLNKSTNFRILRLGLNSFPLVSIRSHSVAPIGIYNHLNSFIKLPRRFVFLLVSRTDMPAILHVKNVNTFPMGNWCTFNLRRAQHFHPWRKKNIILHLISGDNKIKTYSSQHVNWFPACVRASERVRFADVARSLYRYTSLKKQILSLQFGSFRRFLLCCAPHRQQQRVKFSIRTKSRHKSQWYLCTRSTCECSFTTVWIYLFICFCFFFRLIEIGAVSWVVESLSPQWQKQQKSHTINKRVHYSLSSKRFFRLFPHFLALCFEHSISKTMWTRFCSSFVSTMESTLLKWNDSPHDLGSADTQHMHNIGKNHERCRDARFQFLFGDGDGKDGWIGIRWYSRMAKVLYRKLKTTPKHFTGEMTNEMMRRQRHRLMNATDAKRSPWEGIDKCQWRTPTRK